MSRARAIDSLIKELSALAEEAPAAVAETAKKKRRTRLTGSRRSYQPH